MRFLWIGLLASLSAFADSQDLAVGFGTSVRRKAVQSLSERAQVARVVASVSPSTFVEQKMSRIFV